MCISIPPKYSVAQVSGDVKGKSAIAVARHYGGGSGISMERAYGIEVMQFPRLDLNEERW
jgi:hypothetical protein